MATVFPIPTLAGQSPGLGDMIGFGVGGGGVGLLDPPAAEEEPQLVDAVAMPIATMVRSIAVLPTALPTEVRNSRRAILFLAKVI